MEIFEDINFTCTTTPYQTLLLSSTEKNLDYPAKQHLLWQTLFLDQDSDLKFQQSITMEKVPKVLNFRSMLVLFLLNLMLLLEFRLLLLQFKSNGIHQEDQVVVLYFLIESSWMMDKEETLKKLILMTTQL